MAVKRMVAVLVICVITIASVSVVAADNYMYVNGGKLTVNDKEIVLNGVNLGGWLLQESWMGPVADAEEKFAYTDVINILTSRFGKDKATELINIYEDNFITESDFKIISELGFNCVRIPFWYRNFMTEDYEWLTGNMNDNPGFKRLDWALLMCEKYNLYAILDMHGCPGGQSMNHSTGTIGKNGLYLNKKNLDTMESVWREIANRYKDNKYVAAYDVMNEPQNNGGFSGSRAWRAESAEAVSLTNSVYKRMVSAIREIDTKHIITVEGIWTVNVLPNPEEYGWDNMMYQAHIYDNTSTMITKRISEFLDVRQRYGVAVLSGEYNSGRLEGYASARYEAYDISRIKWTYKTVGEGAVGWGLYNKSFKKVDIEKASYEEIKKAFGADMRTESGFVLDEKECRLIL